MLNETEDPHTRANMSHKNATYGNLKGKAHPKIDILYLTTTHKGVFLKFRLYCT